MERDDYSDSSYLEEEEELETIQVENFEYKILKSSNAILTKVNKTPTTPTHVTVPAHIEHNGSQYKVTGIGARALRETKITTLDFDQDSVITTLRKDSMYCHTLTELTLPPRLLTLERGWCNFTLKLVKINVPEGNENFVAPDGKALYSSALDVLYFVQRTVRNFEVPNTVKTIGSFAFEQCRRLKSLTFEDESHLVRIDPWAFSHVGLKSVEFPRSLETISYDSFFHSHRLEEIKFPRDSRLKGIFISAFKDTHLTHVVLPASCKKIAIASFQACPRLTEVKLESTDYVQIWRDAFNGAHSSFKVVAYEGLEIKGTGAAGLNVERVSNDAVQEKFDENGQPIDDAKQEINS